MDTVGNAQPEIIDTWPLDNGMEWSSIYDSVFDQYLDGGDLFMSDDGHSKDNSRADIGNFSSFFAGTDQSGQPNGTMNSIPQDPGRSVLQQRQSVYRWSVSRSPMILEAPEQSPFELVHEQQPSVATRSYPDFLGLGGFPSPPATSASSMSPPKFIQFKHSRPIRRTKTQRERLFSKSKSFSPTLSVSACDSIAGAPDDAILPGWDCGSKTTLASPDETLKRNDGRRNCSGTGSCVSGPHLSSPQTSSSFPAPPKSQDVRMPSIDDLQDYEDFAPGDKLAFRRDETARTNYIQEVLPLAKSLQQTHLYSSINTPGSGQMAGLEHTLFSSPLPLSSQPYGSRSVYDAAPFFRPLQIEGSVSQKSQDFQCAVSQNTKDNHPYASSGPEQYRLSALCDNVEIPRCNLLSGTDDTILESIENADGEFPFTDDNGLDIEGEIVSPNPTSVKLSSSWLGYGTNPETTTHPTTMLNAMASQTQPRPLRQRSRRNADLSIAQREHSDTVSHFCPSPSPSIAASLRRTRDSRRKIGRSRNRANASGHGSQHVRRERNTGRHAFVNYTPQDHRKLLSGVAASGSFKTKARRDREMEVKRRRINQAAVMAVIEAGGDLERLRGEGLLN